MVVSVKVLPQTVEDLERKKFDVNSKNETVVRTIQTTKNVNALDQETTTIGTSAALLTFVTGATSFEIFHQHETAKLYFGDSSVSSSGYPYIQYNDTLSLEVKDTIELYAVSDTAGVEVFILGEIKE